jgi:hypothetical protein
MSDTAYDAIQDAMSDYVKAELSKRWPADATSDFDAGVVGSVAAGDQTAAGTVQSRMNNLSPALTGVRTEMLADRAIVNRLAMLPGGGRRLQSSGNEMDLQTTLTFRDLSQEEDTQAAAEAGVEFKDAQASSVPSEEVLLGAAGDLWNDLSTFINEYLYKTLAAEGVEAEFANLDTVVSKEVFPTSPPTESPTSAPTSTNNVPPEDENSQVDNNENSVSQIVDSSNMNAQPDSSVNPLYLALGVGVTVFLCTVIVLGMRRQRHTELIGNKPEAVAVHERYNQDGEQEIEVEDHYFSSCNTQVPGAVSNNRGAAGRGICGMLSPRSRALDNTYDDSFDEDLDGEHLDSHGSVDDEDPAPSIAGVAREDMDLYADLTSDEKQLFLEYMHSGMSIEEASQQILEDRQRRSSVMRSPRASYGQRKSNQRLRSEVMSDGKTMVHIPQHLSHPSARKFAQPMLLSEADSSVASSFDDREYYANHSRIDSSGKILHLGGGGGSSSSRRRGATTDDQDIGHNILCYP